MQKNYLKGTIGNDLNANLAATGYNLRVLLRKIIEEILRLIFTLIDFWKFKNHKLVICCL